jgi:hypothetical protein
MAFSGSIVTAGRGHRRRHRHRVPTPRSGKINRMISEVETLATPLTRQMAAFSKVLSFVIIGMAALMFASGWALHDYTVAKLFFAAIGFAVAAIPEGLPAILTITLAIGVQSMARRNAITRQLTSVETLGSVTVICSDKTGTLTRNEMTARQVITHHRDYQVTGIGYAPEGKITFDGDPPRSKPPDLQALIEAMAVCNDSEIAEKDGPLDRARRAHRRRPVLPRPQGRFRRRRLQAPRRHPLRVGQQIHGHPQRLPGWRGTAHPHEGRAGPSAGPLRWQQRGAGERQRTDWIGAYWNCWIDTLGGQGLRVLAPPCAKARSDKNDLAIEDLDEGDGLSRPGGHRRSAAPEAIEAIAQMPRSRHPREDDHRRPRRHGLRHRPRNGHHDGEHAVTGANSRRLDDEELRAGARHDIFARTSPEHKLRLVKALQANGEVVAMTGDGVNDAPALKRADVGVAMGIKGTEATKEAADIVLADDNFASIERAVEEGRTIYDNLRKAILFILPTNGAEALVILIAVAFGWVLPMTPVQILWVNMVTAVTLALALAFEPSEPGIMQRPPRDPGAHPRRALLWRISFVSLLIGGATIAVFVIERRLECRSSWPAPSPSTRSYARRSSTSSTAASCARVVWFAITALASCNSAFVYLPFMQTAFGTVAPRTAPLARPAEGIDDHAGYDRLLGLETLGYRTLAGCALGFRSPEDAYATHPKVRYPKDEVVLTR